MGILDYMENIVATKADPALSTVFVVRFLRLREIAEAFRLSVVDGQIGFSRVSGLSSEYEVATYLQGTAERVVHAPTRLKVDDVTLERGVLDLDTVKVLEKWHDSIQYASWRTREGRRPGIMVSNVEIEVPIMSTSSPPDRIESLRQPRATFRTVGHGLRVTVEDAWPKALKFTDLNASRGAVWIMSLALANSGLSFEWF